MRVAINEAKIGLKKNHGGPFGAVIIKDDEIIAKAHNQVLKNNDPTAHAEIGVIRKASKKLNDFNLKDCILYTTCYPCPMCLSAILWARIKIVYYGASENDAENISFDDKKFNNFFKGKNKCLVKLEQLDRKMCLPLFDELDLKVDKQLY